MTSRRESPDPIDLIGDAQLLLTAPFYPDTDPLGQRPRYEMPPDGVLDSERRIVRADRPMENFLRGSLTYADPPVGLLTQFAGTADFKAELAAIVRKAVNLPVRLEVNGVIFPDGYGAVAVLMEVADGWGAAHRERFVDGFGPEGRNSVGDKILAVLYPPLAEVSDRCCPHAPCRTILPYFNLTYVAETSHPRPGRGTLPDDLRLLVYPRSPAPIPSDSPWSDEFFYAGYAFSLLASRNPWKTLEQLEHLLLYVDVQYSRMDRSAAAADRLVRALSVEEDPDWLVAAERRLRADYQALVRPTFSYDYHVLKLRDSLLHAWDTDKIRERADMLVQMAREAVERKYTQEQARRVSRVKLVVTILTVLSLVQSVDAAIDLWSRLH